MACRESINGVIGAVVVIDVVVVLVVVAVTDVVVAVVGVVVVVVFLCLKLFLIIPVLSKFIISLTCYLPVSIFIVTAKTNIRISL